MSDSKTGSKLMELSTVFTLENRFERDFEITKKIGAGGFAKVYRAKNLLDDTEYAIKKIVLNMSNKSAKRIRHEIDTVLNEIRCLARIKNEHVVRYNHSWIEVVLKQNEIGLDQETEFLGEQNLDKSQREDNSLFLSYFEYESENKLGFLEENCGCVSICTCNFSGRREMFASCENSHDNAYIHRNKRKVSEKSKKYPDEDNDERIKISSTSYRVKDIKKIKIFIQMELCKETLGEFLSRRSSKTLSEIDTKENLLEIFNNIVETVDDLHQKEKIIHRDLKPNNIFLTTDKTVKIGDFGLATELFNIKYKKISIDTSDTSLSRKNSISSTSSNSSIFDGSSSCVNYHTKNVGTIQYASPEQLNDNFYDYKSDIYSLGLILFEMIYPITTGMQRHQVLKELKEQRKLPEVLVKESPVLSSLVIKMTEFAPNRRPEAKEILEILQIEINKLKKIPLRRKTNNGFLNLNLPEDIKLSNIFHLEVKIDDEIMSNYPELKFENPFKRLYVKIIDDKLLILPKNNSLKALFVYELHECEILSKEEQLEVNHPYMNKIIIKTPKQLTSEFYEKIKSYL